MILDFLYSLNIVEAFLLIILSIGCLRQLINSYLSNEWIDIFKPINLFALLTLFYCVIGPILSSGKSGGEIIFRATNHREYYQIGLLAASLSFFSFQAGFNFKNCFTKKKFGLNKILDNSFDRKKYLVLHRWGEFTFLTVIFLQFLGFGLTFINRLRFVGGFRVSVNSLVIGDAFNNYASSSVNFLIISILLMYVALLNGSKERTKFAFYITLTISMFLNLGFRWRLVMILLPMFLIYFFYKKTKPKLSLLISLALSTILAFGFIQTTRQYGSGLNFGKLKTRDFIYRLKKRDQTLFGYIIRSAFMDTNVFNTSAGMIYKTPSRYDYVGIAPLTNAIASPIPRKIWPGKPAGEYISNLYKKIYVFDKWEVGSASLGFAEYYISGGWIALLTLNFLLGYFYKRLWFWFMYNFKDPIAQINYAISLSFLFILYSRGYLLQIVFLYLTIFIPYFICAYFWNKRIQK